MGEVNVLRYECIAEYSEVSIDDEVVLGCLKGGVNVGVSGYERGRGIGKVMGTYVG